jgi:hypothetical protein
MWRIDSAWGRNKLVVVRVLVASGGQRREVVTLERTCLLLSVHFSTRVIVLVPKTGCAVK